MKKLTPCRIFEDGLGSYTVADSLHNTVSSRNQWHVPLDFGVAVGGLSRQTEEVQPCQEAVFVHNKLRYHRRLDTGQVAVRMSILGEVATPAKMGQIDDKMRLEVTKNSEQNFV